MKASRFLLFFWCVLLLLSGCVESARSGFTEPMSCSYLRRTPEYGVEDGVIASETREASGHSADLRYLFSMYLNGPTDQSLISPFPNNTRLVSISIDDEMLEITLSEEFTKLENAELTLACACITKTALGICDVNSVRVIAESEDHPAVDFLLQKDQLLLFDRENDTQSDSVTP